MSLDLTNLQYGGLVLQIVIILWVLALLTFVIRNYSDQGGGLYWFGAFSLLALPFITAGAWALTVL